MKKWHLAGAALAVAAIPALSAGCDPAPLGELVLIVKTDMAPPKDFNKLRIEVFNEGALKFEYEGPVPGDPKDEQRIVLPSTLGLVAPEDPSNAIRIEVGVRSGGKDGPVRVVREVVTTIPADRVAMLNIPIQFLCKSDDIPFDPDGNLKPSDCPDGKTCIAGTCEDSAVDSSTLPDYDEKSVYGGNGDPAKGKCFDVATCFEKGVLVDAKTIDKASCTFPLPKGVESKKMNLALGVESDGICNSIGCLVALDANSETGWRLDDAGTNVVLPKGVCANLDPSTPSPHPILQIVQAATSGDCPQKDVTYPTCGDWSAVSSAASAKASPKSIAGAQDHPISMTIRSSASGDFAYWTNGGGNTVKGTSLDGGTLITLDSPDPPRDIIATDKALFWTGANGLGSVNMFLDNPGQGQDPFVQLATGIAQPDGLTIFSDASVTKLFWTEFAEPGRIFTATMNASYTAFDQKGVQELVQGNSYPARMVADKSYVYWTNEGAFDKTNGSVMRVQHAVQGPTPLTFAVDGNVPLAAPRAIAIDTSGNGTTIYFATIADDKVWRITNADAASPDPARVFADGLSAPNGIALDANRVFIANRGDGTVVYKEKTAAAGDPVKPVASGQKNPGTMLVHKNFLVWVNEGPSASEAKEGSIVKLDITNL